MNYPKISSPVCDVYWAGWRSNTFTLQMEGWQISSEQDITQRRLRIALKHPRFNIYGVTDFVEMNFQEMAYTTSLHNKIPTFAIKHMTSRFEIQLMDDFSKFSPIDAEPIFAINPPKKMTMEDFMIFRPINKASEIIIPDFEVPELLDMILKKQDPKQAEIRENKRREWRKFTKGINAEKVYVESDLDNRNDIVAQLICV